VQQFDDLALRLPRPREFPLQSLQGLRDGRHIRFQVDEVDVPSYRAEGSELSAAREGGRSAL
jgi:hypothetical protein